MKEHLEKVSDFVSRNKLSFSDGLLKLCNYEIDYKTIIASKSMIKAQRFHLCRKLKITILISTLCQ